MKNFFWKLKLTIAALACLIFAIACFVSCDDDLGVPWLEADEELSAGAATVFNESLEAFNKVAPLLSNDNFKNFQRGNSFFRTAWVASPASTTARDGLGPIMNAISCTGCHVRDGRGTPPSVQGTPLSSMLLRLSIPGQNAHGGQVPDPVYGGQLQNRANLGITPEGNVEITYTEITGEFADGESYSLRKPTYQFTNLGYGAMSPQVMHSPRTAPAIYGLGLLEAIPESAILANADESDADGDGISGRPNQVWDVAKQARVMGRFGWKANQPSLRQQNAGAFNGDLGLTSSIFPNLDCTSAEQDCQTAPNGGNPEITDQMLDFVTAYTQSIGVPVRRNWDEPEVLRGKQLFFEANCNSCHVQDYTIEALGNITEYKGLKIRPYTDLLLHDMGEELADNRPDYEATGKEWRTPPLWGIGLIEKVNGHTNLMHDGRARNFMEAILWHGGEAQEAKNTFINFQKSDREALVRFLESL